MRYFLQVFVFVLLSSFILPAIPVFPKLGLLRHVENDDNDNDVENEVNDNFEYIGQILPGRWDAIYVTLKGQPITFPADILPGGEQLTTSSEAHVSVTFTNITKNRWKGMLATWVVTPFELHLMFNKVWAVTRVVPGNRATMFTLTLIQGLRKVKKITYDPEQMLLELSDTFNRDSFVFVRAPDNLDFEQALSRLVEVPHVSQEPDGIDGVLKHKQGTVIKASADGVWQNIMEDIVSPPAVEI